MSASTSAKRTRSSNRRRSCSSWPCFSVYDTGIILVGMHKVKSVTNGTEQCWLGKSALGILGRHFQLQGAQQEKNGKPSKSPARKLKKHAKRQQEQHNSTKTTEKAFGICDRMKRSGFSLKKKRVVISSSKIRYPLYAGRGGNVTDINKNFKKQMHSSLQCVFQIVLACLVCRGARCR